MKFIDSVIVYSPDLHNIVQFYRALGIPLIGEEHEEGAAHFACELGAIHIAFYQSEEAQVDQSRALKRGCAGAVQLGFQVDSVEETIHLVRKLGAKVLIEPEVVPWGRRAVFEDPDGRPIEVNAS